jgi:hypothetical protein
MRDRFDTRRAGGSWSGSRAHRQVRFADLKPGLPAAPFFILRHDVDYSPAAALSLAEAEAARGVGATYFLLLNTSYYNLLSPEHAGVARRIGEMGHEVGLHYDLRFLRAFPRDRWEELLDEQARLLGTLSGVPVESIALHQPALVGEDPLRGRTRFLDAYEDRFFKEMAYVSDSCRAWRDSAWRMLAAGPVPERLQLVLHPLNWGAEDRSRAAIFAGIHRAAGPPRRGGARPGREGVAALGGPGARGPAAARARARRDRVSAAEDGAFEILRGLWPASSAGPFAELLPRDAASLADFYPRLQRFVAGAPRSRAGSVDPAALVRGEIVSMGEGSVIEAGAVIHESCRLVLGPGSRIAAAPFSATRSWWEPSVSASTARCSGVLWPADPARPFRALADSIVGADVSVAGNAVFASSIYRRTDREPQARGQKVETGRSHLGALVGDGVRLGASTTLCPGCIVTPGLSLPPAATLYGTVDARRRDALMRRFFEAWEV